MASLSFCTRRRRGSFHYWHDDDDRTRLDLLGLHHRRGPPMPMPMPTPTRPPPTPVCAHRRAESSDRGQRGEGMALSLRKLDICYSAVRSFRRSLFLPCYGPPSSTPPPLQTLPLPFSFSLNVSAADAASSASISASALSDPMPRRRPQIPERRNRIPPPPALPRNDWEHQLRESYAPLRRNATERPPPPVVLARAGLIRA